jgi:TPR repeat protein
MYLNGEGVTRDRLQAHVWLSLAASRDGGDRAQQFADARDAVTTYLLPSQISEAKRLAEEWTPKTWEDLQ